jgi:hypothetical protein
MLFSCVVGRDFVLRSSGSARAKSVMVKHRAVALLVCWVKRSAMRQGPPANGMCR